MSEILAELEYPPEHVATVIKTLEAPPIKNGKRLVTPKQLCDLLGVSRTTLWRLQLPSIYVGRRRRYDFENVVETLARRRTAGAQQENGAT